MSVAVLAVAVSASALAIAMFRDPDGDERRRAPAPDDARLEFQNAGRAWSARSRDGINHYEVRGGDHLAGDGEAKERSEAFSPIRMAAGQSYDIGFDVMIEPGPRNSAAWMTIAQLQSTFDKGEPGHSPPFALEMVGERMRVVIRTDPMRISVPNGFTFKKLYQDDADIVRGRWYAMRIRVTFDPFGAGVLKVWRDGRMLVDYHGPIGFDDERGPYFKQGVYRASAPEPFAVDFRGLTIAPTHD